MAVDFENSSRNFPVVEMTISKYQALPDYSVSYTIDRTPGDMGKISGLSMPGEYLIEIVREDCVQICYCKFIKEN